MKSGIVALIGRPNTGKSTLVNTIIGQKVSITSPKPQTTRFPIHAVYEDDRGQIVFMDTPGIFGKTPDELSKLINPRTENFAGKNIDCVLYLVDHTRKRDYEENVTLGIVRTIKCPKILVVNKIDMREPSYRVNYSFIEDECDAVVEISALKRKHINTLLDTIFSLLPERKAAIDTGELVHPTLNLDSKTYISEIIREKAFLFLREEIPYKLTVSVDDIQNRVNGVLYIKARILTASERYKPMIIGKNGSMIKEISMASRKELETATNKNVYVDLMVEADDNWLNYL